MKILVFDTETNDKAKNFKIRAEEDLTNYPYLIQIAARLVDYDRWLEEYRKNKIDALDMSTIEVLCEYVYPYRVEEGNHKNITVSKGSYKVHGISLDKLKAEGIDLDNVLDSFQSLVKRADLVVAHNLNFDRNVMVSEYLRLGLSLRIDRTSKKWCSMLGTKDILKLPGNYNNYKWPSLQELYQYCFNTTFEDGHDALVDVDRTTECVLHLLRTKQLTF